MLKGTSLGSPVVNNPPCNAGDEGSVPGSRSKIPRCHGATKPVSPNYRVCPWQRRSHMKQQRSSMPQQRPNAAKWININKYVKKKKKKSGFETLDGEDRKLSLWPTGISSTHVGLETRERKRLQNLLSGWEVGPTASPAPATREAGCVWVSS